MAERPVGTAQPGVGGTHDDADRDQPESGRKRQRGKLLEAVHEVAILALRRIPTDLDTLCHVIPRRLPLILVALAIVVAACASSGTSTPSSGASATPDLSAWGAPPKAPSLIPVLITNAVPAGKSRILMLYLDSANRVKSAPDRSVKVAFYDLDRDPAKVVTTADGSFVWTIQGERGMYAVNVDLPDAGTVGRGVHHRRRRARRPRPSA